MTPEKGKPRTEIRMIDYTTRKREHIKVKQTTYHYPDGTSDTFIFLKDLPKDEDNATSFDPNEMHLGTVMITLKFKIAWKKARKYAGYDGDRLRYFLESWRFKTVDEVEGLEDIREDSLDLTGPHISSLTGRPIDPDLILDP